MLQTKNGINWPCCFSEAIKNVKHINAQTHDYGQWPISIGHLSNSGDLKSKKYEVLHVALYANHAHKWYFPFSLFLYGKGKRVMNI